MFNTNAQVAPTHHPYRISNQSAVAIRHMGRKVGLYRVRRVEDGMMVLSHGGISFPVGTRLFVEDMQGLIHGAPRGCFATRVVANDINGLSLVW